MKPTLQTILFVSIFSFTACQSPSNNSKNTDSLSADTAKVDTTSNAAGHVEKKPTATDSTKWEYHEEEDKMTSKKTYFASIEANQQLQFDFPYDGGVTASILVRKKGGENEVMLNVSKGQFNMGIDGGSLKARFDSDKAKTYSTSGPSDQSGNVMFISSAGGFIKNLKTHKKLLIETEFYNEGSRQMEFDIADFKWDH
ncbi:hypothetical protein INP83_18845 [Mucilaginibacter sp. 21P]|uniref:hypothetical protein n=1 Tax=Mucilaginibacter sp. 21P TaxID=2778902 RepID=UPI001C57B49E|nr:hypothetical protein [Mucilaginibacter sp. 21P]QXV65112.1 hypothetical protein INP83_18845 [Mucilaginibacter sp. 21P]